MLVTSLDICPELTLFLKTVVGILLDEEDLLMDFSSSIIEIITAVIGLASFFKLIMDEKSD